jgi:hypothetical protein
MVMVSAMTLIGTVVAAIFASTGFWTYINYLTQRKDTKSQMLKGLGHDRICCLGESYIKRGYITKDEYENLHDYLYLPYKKLGGNGTAEKIVKDVSNLPLREKGGH